MQDIDLPDGVIMRPLVRHADARGALAEMYRTDWVPSDTFPQWNFVQSAGDVMRGVHVHPWHNDYLVVVAGTLVLGLHDLRPDRPGDRKSALVTLKGSDLTSVFIPPGVCHGFFFPEAATFIFGQSKCWSMAEELGCRYDDPALGLDWPTETPMLSARDTTPPYDYAGMRAAWFATRARSAVA
jgi:dTDP-4-dehydrorhamnose 3,5-epimerase